VVVSSVVPPTRGTVVGTSASLAGGGDGASAAMGLVVTTLASGMSFKGGEWGRPRAFVTGGIFLISVRAIKATAASRSASLIISFSSSGTFALVSFLVVVVGVSLIVVSSLELVVLVVVAVVDESVFAIVTIISPSLPPSTPVSINESEFEYRL